MPSSKTATPCCPLRATSAMASLPVIGHPATLLANKNELRVVGSSTPAQLDMAGGSCETLRRRILCWPPEHLQPSLPGQRRLNKKQFNLDKLEAQISERIYAHLKDLKHMFRSNDTSGHGGVSKEALLKILWHVCGYIPTQYFHSFLVRHGLDQKSQITFDNFMCCFKESEPSQLEWMCPVQAIPLKEEQSRYSPDNLGWIITVYSASHAMALLKQKTHQRNFDATKLLPPACLAPPRLVVPPQLREFLAQLGICLSDNEFGKLWLKFDLGNTHAIHTSSLLTLLNLDANGRPITSSPCSRLSVCKDRPKTASPSMHISQCILRKDGHGEGSQPIETDKSKEKAVDSAVDAENLTEEMSTDNRMKVVIKKKADPATLKIPPAVDCLHQKFEDSYENLMLAMQLFDVLQDGYISKIDLAIVLAEFGMKVSPIELEHFLARNAIRPVQGQLNYRRLLSLFQSVGDNSITSNILNSPEHVFQSADLSLPVDKMMSAEELEAHLVYFFHRDYLRLISSLRAADRHAFGMVTNNDLRMIVERILGDTLSEGQWTKLQEETGVDHDGYIAYNRLLRMFDIVPGSWNTQLENSHVISQVTSNVSNLRPELKNLKEKAKLFKRLEKKSLVAGMQDQMIKKLENQLREELHKFDMLFREMDRDQTGRMSKWQLGALMGKCGIYCSLHELEVLWSSMKTAHDNMLTYNQLLKNISSKPKELRQELPATVLSKQRDSDASKQRRSMEKDGKGQAPLHINEVHELLERIEPIVLAHWNDIKAMFRRADNHGYTTVPQETMREIFDAFLFDLSKPERAIIVQKFDVGKKGRFHYLLFLRLYAEKQFKREPAMSSRVTYPKVLHKLQKKLLKEWKNLRRAFRKMDLNNDGFVDVIEFKKGMKAFGMSLSDEEIYHILSEFDVNMDGKISYEEFIHHLLDVQLP